MDGMKSRASMGGVMRSLCGAGQTQKATKNETAQRKDGEKKKKKRVRWTKPMTWRRFNEETGVDEEVLCEEEEEEQVTSNIPEIDNGTVTDDGMHGGNGPV